MTGLLLWHPVLLMIIIQARSGQEGASDKTHVASKSLGIFNRGYI